MATTRHVSTDTASTSASAPPSSGWLIEAAGPSYLAVSKLHKQLHWTAHHQDALRFANEQSATLLRDAARELQPHLFPDCYPMPKATEHLWLEGTKYDDSSYG